MEAWNRKIKGAARAYRKNQTADNRKELLSVLESCMKEYAQNDLFLPWYEMIRRLEADPLQQMLLCVLWEGEFSGRLDMAEFRRLCESVTEDELCNISLLPEWIYESEGQIMLSPILFAWLEQLPPILPKGAELILPRQEKIWGIEALLTESEQLWRNAKRDGEPLIFCVEGEPGSGRLFFMEQLCARQKMTLLLLDGEVFAGTQREINTCVFCATLFDAFVCVRLGKEVRGQLLKSLSQSFWLYGIIKDDKMLLDENPPAVVLYRQLLRPGKQCKKQIVESILGEDVSKLPEGLRAEHFIGRHLPMGIFLRYIKGIKAELDAGTVGQHMAPPKVSTSLSFMPATRTFEELKLPKAQYGQLKQISRMIAAREEVMEQWGFGDKFSYGNGMSILFYGAPGTGKTMAAQVLANELGLPLYRVDLSQLISKYIGETQKNIGRIFEEADRCDCILLFDEADAIFTKRSDVSDAQDRYSNAETAYLLQRIEQYSGVSILATNLLQNFDDAFRRRISYMVHFPMPDMGLRKELWDTIFPAATPVSGEVDTLLLARTFELSGALIKNAALHAALMARAEGCEVRMSHILRGISNEYEKLGKVFTTAQKELLGAFCKESGMDNNGGGY